MDGLFSQKLFHFLNHFPGLVDRFFGDGLQLLPEVGFGLELSCFHIRQESSVRHSFLECIA